MSSQKFQSAHSSIYKLGTRLVEYIDEIRQSRLKEGDDTKSLESVENNIKKALTALQQQKYQLAVIAAMNAGKSTFLNAIIGADVLASETAACTICRTDVRHIPANQVPRLLEYQAGVRKPIVIAEGDEGEIQHKFLLRTRKIRETGNPDNTIRFEIEHHIEAISGLSSLDGFTLVDTPGPNEWKSANFNTVALKQTALEALRTCNAILFILNYESYKDIAVFDLFKEVLENRREILEQEKGKIYFILNKVDQKTNIREKLALKIENDIQEISNELSDYLGKELQVKLNINKIQFPKFEFPGIDARIKQQQEVFTRTKKEERTESRCCDSDKVYYVDVEYQDRQDFYEVDLRQTRQLIHQKIDEQVLNNRELLQRVIEKQIADDFKKAEQQINDYIRKFQDDFDSLLKERETKEAESDKIINNLNLQKEKLKEYLQELISIRQSLNTWKP